MLRADWRETVDEIERGLKACLESLDRYESQFQAVLTADPPPTADPHRHLPAKGDGWATHLAAAGERAAAVERLLDEQDAVWQRFRTALAETRESLERA
jgi:hypothetical protein